jgi:hypothetical protein
MNISSMNHAYARPWGRLDRPVLVIMLALACTAGLSACDLGKTTVNTTSEVLWRAQPALEQESDYELAARAIPGTLKTIEGFWYVDKSNPRLTLLLAKGYCQYGTGFVEDEWEMATLEKRLDRADQLSARATKMFVRCTNYAVRLLGKKWQPGSDTDTQEKGIFADFETVRKLIASTGKDKRDALMWAAIGLASTINQNKDNITIVTQLPTAKMMLEKIVELDDKHNYKHKSRRALPHIVLGMLYTAQAPALGGEPERGAKHFKRAMEITENKFLLAQVLYARRYAVMMQDRKLFRDTLVGVLQTPPSIWPEERLANEIAHRRARRYLEHEKQWF